MRFPNFYVVIRALIFLVIAVGLSACSGCDEETSAGSAEVSIDVVDPEAGYQEVEFTVGFTITPGEGTSADGMSWRANFGDGTQTSGDGVEGQVTHAYELPGTYEITVSAVFESEVVGQATTTFQVYGPVDLSVQGVSGRPANIRTDGEVTISLDVSNTRASDVLTNFEVGFYLSESRDVSLDDLEELASLDLIEVEANIEGDPVIPTDTVRSVGATSTIPGDLESGDYFVVAVIDPQEKVGDTDRTNNLEVSNAIRIENVSDSAPDLEVSGIFVIPDRAFPELNSFTRTFQLANRGSVDAFDVVARTYLSIGDPNLDESDILVHTSEPVTVFARDEDNIGPTGIVLDTAITPPAGMPLDVWVIVEVDSTEPGFEDADPSNNLAVGERQIVVSDEPVEGPDIVVNSFEVSPESTFLNGTLEIKTSIENQGTQDVGSFFCAIYLGDDPVVDTQNDPRLENINVPTLASNQTLDVDRSITVPGLYPAGIYYLYLVCDPTNALQEPFRSNNAAIYPNPITVTDEADVDLRIDSIELPAAVNEGDAFDLEVRVCAGGSNPTGATRAEVFKTPGAQPDFTSPPLLSFDVPNVNPGECEDIIVELEASCDDFVERYAYGVLLDADNVLPETNENNNRGAGSNQQIVSGTFCSCEEDMFEPNDTTGTAANLAPGTTDAALCDPGSCDYFKVPLAANDSLVVTTLLESSKGDLVTALFDPSGVQQLDSSGADDKQSTGVFLVSTAGDYFVRVCGEDSMDRNLYSLDVTVFPQSTTVDVVARDVTVPTRSFFSVGAQVDVGYRVYNVGQQEATSFDARVIVSPNQVLGDGDDVIVANAAAGPVPGGTFRDRTIPSTLPTSLMDGDYYIAVVLDPLASLTESDITNNVAFSRKITVGRQCFDPLEPNDTFSEAPELTSGTFSNLIACTAAPDFYRICPGDAQTVTATANFDSSQGDIDLFLHDQATTEIDSSAGVGGTEQVGVAYVNGAQCYFVQVRVQALPGQTVELSYELDLNIQDVDPSLRCDGSFESNDSFATASSLLAAAGQSFQMDRCPQTDTDFYYVDLSAGQTVSFRGIKDPSNQPGTLRLQLYLPSQTPGPNQETAPGVPVAEIADYTAPASGRYYVQVTVGGSQRNVTYRVETDGLDGIDLAPQNAVIGPGTYLPNDEIRLGFDLVNLGATTAVAPEYEVFFGTQPVRDPANDVSLGSAFTADVPGNSSFAVNARFNVPSTAMAGTAYLHVVVDPNSVITDTNRTNNLTSIPIDIGP